MLQQQECRPLSEAGRDENFRFNEVLPADFDNAKDKPSLIILDDLLNKAHSKDVCDLFTTGRLYMNISFVILITQNLFHQGRYSREISLNAKYLVVLKKVRDKNQFFHLGTQVYPEDSDGMFRAYLNATEAPYGYLDLDLSQDMDESLRFRTCIFPDEAPSVKYADIGDETHKGKLPHSSCTPIRTGKFA